jgi:putative membrane protein
MDADVPRREVRRAARGELALKASAFCAVLFGASAASAHEGEAHLAAAEVLSSFTWDPLVLFGLALSSYGYARGLRRLWKSAGAFHGVRPVEAGAYAAGIFGVAVALVSPLDPLSDKLFSAHMSQHEVLMLVAAPLIVLGRPLVPFLWALSPRLRERATAIARGERARGLWRALTGPLFVVLLHGVVVWVWHVPALFEAALLSEVVHAAQHAMFFVTAALFWWSLIHGRYGRAGYGMGVLYVFVTALHTSILGALMTVARRVWYPLYEGRAAAVGVEAIDDQALAGIIMWVPSGVLFAVLGLALFAAWIGEAERRARRSPYGGAVVRAPREIEEVDLPGSGSSGSPGGGAASR